MQPKPASVGFQPTLPTSRHLRFREISNRGQLRELFAIRYQVYLDTGYLSPNEDGLDVDPYDLHSRFLGAWLVEDGRERMIGGVRMMYHRHRSPLHLAVRDILSSTRSPALLSLGSRPTPFISQKTFDLDDVLQECERDGLDIVEFSRTVCLKEYRGLNVGHGLVSGIFGMALNEGIEMGVGSTPPSLLDFYVRHGCRPLARRESGWYEELNTSLHALLIDLRRLPEPTATEARNFGERLRADGSFCLCARLDCVTSRYLDASKPWPCPEQESRLLLQ